MRLLVHGCYDKTTLTTLLELGAKRFAFDLRGRSPNLVPYSELREFIKLLAGKEVVLIFEDDKDTTIFSFLDLLKDLHVDLVLEFRDCKDLKYYESFKTPFYWLFNPTADWRTVLHSTQVKGVLLPLILKDEFKRLPAFWSMVEARNLEVMLHVDKFSEAPELTKNEDLSLSIDLTREVEAGFRRVDQERLKKMKFWRNLNESAAF